MMKRKHKTLNEELNRIKSLFTEERLYGNLVGGKENELITEQPVQLLKNLFNLKKTKNLFINKKLFPLTDLDNFSKSLDNLNDFEDFSKIINDYRGIWKTIIPQVKDWKNVSGVFDYVKLKEKQLFNLSDEKFNNFKKSSVSLLPKEGGIRDIYIFMLNKKRKMYKPTKTKVDPKPTNSGNMELYTPKVDSKGKTIESIEDFLVRINKGIDWQKVRKMTVADVENKLKDGKTLMVVLQDGKWKFVDEIQMRELNVNDKGEITSNVVKSNKILPKIKKGTWQAFRYIFPTYSAIGKYVNMSLKGVPKAQRTWWDSDRFSILGKKSSWFRDRAKFTENLVRVLAVEQTALMTINYGKKSIERGELGNLSQMWSDYFAGEDSIGKFNVSYLLGMFTGEVWESLKDMRENALSVCRTKCDNEVIAHKAEVEADEDNVEDPDLYDNCFEACEKGVNDFYDKLDEFEKSMKGARELFVEYDLTNIDNWDINQINNYCENKDNRRSKINTELSTIKDQMKSIEKEIDQKFDSNVSGWMSAVKGSLNWLGFEVDGVEEMKKTLFNTDVDGNALTSDGVGLIQNKLDKACEEAFNSETEGDGIYSPSENEGDDEEGTNGTDTIQTTQQKKKKFGLAGLTVEIEPIELIS